MIPLRDNLPSERRPLLTAVLVAACLALAPGSLAGLPAALAVWLFARRLEDGLGPVKALALLSAATAAGVASTGELGAAAAAGALAGAAAGGYLASWPRAKVIGLVLVPFYVTVVEVPAAFVAAALVIAAAALGAPVLALAVAAIAAAALSAGLRVERRAWEPVT